MLIEENAYNLMNASPFSFADVSKKTGYTLQWVIDVAKGRGNNATIENCVYEMLKMHYGKKLPPIDKIFRRKGYAR